MNKFSHLFNEDMTTLEARTVLFSEVDGKTQEDVAELRAAFSEVAPAIIWRELQEATNGRMD